METKKCSKCGINYCKSQFHKVSAASDQVRAVCKTCQHSYGAKYQLTRKEYNAQWYQKNKDRLNAKSRLYHTDNKERLNAKNRQKYYANQAFYIAQRKQYNVRNKSAIAARRLLPENWFRAQLLRLAQRRQFVFIPNRLVDLTNDLCKLLRENSFCPYTQQPLIPGVNLHIDHILPISRGGAILNINNLQLVSEQYNRAKWNLTDSEFARHWKLTWIP